MVKKKDALLGTDPHLFESRDSNVLLSTNELANLTGFKPKTIRRWVFRKLLNYIRVGNRFRFRPAAVKLFLAQREVQMKANSRIEGQFTVKRLSPTTGLGGSQTLHSNEQRLRPVNFSPVHNDTPRGMPDPPGRSQLISRTLGPRVGVVIV